MNVVVINITLERSNLISAFLGMGMGMVFEATTGPGCLKLGEDNLGLV